MKRRYAAIAAGLLCGLVLMTASAKDSTPTPPSADGPKPPATATAHAGHHYQVYDPVDEVSWQKGRDACSKLGGHLATIGDVDEAEFIAKLADERYLFLGASDVTDEGTWVWVDGTRWGYTRWLKGQPNDYGGSEDYLATYDGGDWVDVEESGEDFWMPTGYVCEWDR